MLSGSLAEINLGEVLRLLHSSNQSGALMISGAELIGSIYFQLGQMTHAEAGGVQGMDALSHLAPFTKANFAFQAGVTPSAQTLAPYPTPRLVEKLVKLIAEAMELEATMPLPTAVPKYVPGAGVAGLQASPTELSMLILSNGHRTVAEVATAAKADLEVVQRTLARFRNAGLVEMVVVAVPEPVVPPPAVPPPAPPPIPEPVAPPQTAPSGQTPFAIPGNSVNPESADAEGPRYWRGKRIN